MKRFLFFAVLMFSLSLVSCNGSGTWVCECGDSTSGLSEEGRYDNKDEAESGCYTTEVNLQLQNPDINCLVTEL